MTALSTPDDRPVAVLCGSVTRAVAALDAAEAWYREQGYTVHKPVRNDGIAFELHVDHWYALIDTADVVVACTMQGQHVGEQTRREIERAFTADIPVHNWAELPAVSVSPVDTDGPLTAEQVARALYKAAQVNGNEFDEPWEERSQKAQLRYLALAEDGALPVFEQAHGDLARQARMWQRRAEVSARDAVDATARAMVESGQQRARIRELEAEVASRSTPVLPDGAAGLLWGLALVDEKFVQEFGDGPSETRDAPAEVMRQAAAQSSPATDPEPATPDPTAPYREILGCLWLYVNWHYVTKQLTTEQKELWADAVDGWLEPTETPRAERWWREPVAPQATAEPTVQHKHDINCAHALDDPDWLNSRCDDCDQTGPKGIWCPARCDFARDEPAGPAVPEDTATPGDANPIADVLAARDAVLNAPSRWRADNPGLIPPDDYGDDLGGWAHDSHRADTTRPAGEER